MGTGHSTGIWTPSPTPPSAVIIHSPAGLDPLPPLPVLVLLIYILSSGKWLDKVDETFLKQLQSVSNYGCIDSGKWLDKVDEMCLKRLENVSETFVHFI